MHTKGAFIAITLSVGLCLFLGTQVFAQVDIEKHGSCSYCGMNRGQFSQTRMLIVYDDGSEMGVCSLHCAAVDLALKLDKTPKTIQVGDFNSRKLIDAEQAFWVIGGSKPGVMSKRGKWAFEKKADAEAFIVTNGGSLVSFESAISAAYEDMYADTKMIREKRRMRRMQMEQKGKGS